MLFCAVVYDVDSQIDAVYSDPAAAKSIQRKFASASNTKARCRGHQTLQPRSGDQQKGLILVLLVRNAGQYLTAACQVASVHYACPILSLSISELLQLLKGLLNVTGNVTGMLKGTKATAPLPAFAICTALTAVQNSRQPHAADAELQGALQDI